jgi:hypothetical protein
VNHMRQRDEIIMIIIFVGFAYELVLTGRSLYITCFETFIQHLFGYVRQLVTQASIRCSLHNDDNVEIVIAHKRFGSLSVIVN